MFASLRFSAGPSPEYFSQGLSLGRGSEISYAIVLQVNAPQPSPSGGNYYWQARVYDQYNNGLWTSNYPYTFDVKPPQTILSSLISKGRTTSTFNIYAYKDLGLLFYPSQVVSVNRQVTVYSLRTPEGVPDISLLGLPKTLFAGERYQVLSNLSNVTVRELRDSSVNYPAWVLDHYLQVPSAITPRTLALAKQIKGDLTNPYDISEAVTNYLRENITYSRVIPPIPANQEPLDWFLFDLKEGFCNYYASAEVILLRSLGIPARMAVGYAQGDVVTAPPTPGAPSEYVQFGPQVYQVREKDAHAWPEVYFPGAGWIEFEPTSSIHEIVRPSGDVQPTQPPAQAGGPNPTPLRPTPQLDEPTPQLQTKPKANQNTGRTTTTIVVTIAVLVGLLDLSILIWRISIARWLVTYYKRWGAKPPAFISRWAAEEVLPIPARLEGGLRTIGLQPPQFLLQWALYARLNPVGRSYIEINRALQRLGVLPALDATPAERATILTHLIPTTAEPVNNLIAEYHRGMYSSHPVDPKVARRASQEIRKLSYLALFARWMDRLGKPVRRRPPKTAE
jgi:transglutaminase-like putative cysteine protease